MTAREFLIAVAGANAGMTLAWLAVDSMMGAVITFIGFLVCVITLGLNNGR